MYDLYNLDRECRDLTRNETAACIVFKHHTRDMIRYRAKIEKKRFLDNLCNTGAKHRDVISRKWTSLT